MLFALISALPALIVRGLGFAFPRVISRWKYAWVFGNIMLLWAVARSLFLTPAWMKRDFDARIASLEKTPPADRCRSDDAPEEMPEDPDCFLSCHENTFRITCSAPGTMFAKFTYSSDRKTWEGWD